MCRLKLSMSSIWIPRSSTDEINFITLSSTCKFVFLRSEHFLFNTIAWNLSGFPIILFILNYSIAILLSASNLYIRSEIVFVQARCVWYLAKLWIDSMKEKRSLIERLNGSGPTIDPCDTPKMKWLYVLVIRTHCFQFLK